MANQYGAIFPSSTASVSTRPAPYGYDSRRLLVSNGLNSPGQLDSSSFRSSRPRKVGPRVVRLQQIATGGNVNPKRGGQPSVRNTESSTQAVINAVYVQVLGNAGYAGERLSSDEARLENGDISLRDFVRCVARSDAFRRRYWSGLYIVKAIEVMHRRLLGRPTGRWKSMPFLTQQHGKASTASWMRSSTARNTTRASAKTPFPSSASSPPAISPFAERPLSNRR